MYQSRLRQGDTLIVVLVTTDASGTPVLPDDPPQMAVFNPAGTRVTTVLLPRGDWSQTGHFLGRLHLGAAYSSTGHWQVRLTWATGSHAGLEVRQFELMAGGHADGHLTSLYFYRRPHADFVVRGTESGKILAGRNPTV